MNDKSKHSAFSKYAKGLLSRPTTGSSHDTRSVRNDIPDPYTWNQMRENLCYTADSAISAFAVSPENNQVVLAGREILKILSVGQHEIAEVNNLRGRNRVNLNYSSNDVKWGIGPTSAMVATATSNGSIVTWNVHTGSRRVERAINGHNRAVNRLAFNPGNGSWLLSASQDGSMRLWDLRERDGNARFIMHGKAEAVRDVEFNGTNAVELAAVYDNGTLQKWDLRSPKIYERKFNAHHGPALALHWHADGRHLVTGGRDKVIKIWDMNSDSRRPVCDVHTMAPVARVAWRPGEVAQRCQIASCSLSMDSTVVLWNLRRPYLPSRIFDAHDTVATGILWKDIDCLWSCSKDQTFRQHVVALAPSPAENVSYCAVGWSTDGDIALGIGDPDADKAKMATLEGRPLEAASPQLYADAAKTAMKETRSSDESRRVYFDPRMLHFVPHQSMIVVHTDNDSILLFRHLARSYVTSRENPIGACAKNALVAYRANMQRVSRAWKLIKSELEHIERAKLRADASKLVPSRHESLSRSKAGESLIHRDLERLRSTPVLSDPGHNIMRGVSPATSFIMPRYSDSSLPPLSLPTSTVSSRPRTAESTAATTRPRSPSKRAASAAGKHNPDGLVLPVPTKLEVITNLTDSWGTDSSEQHVGRTVGGRDTQADSSRQSTPNLPLDVFLPAKNAFNTTQDLLDTISGEENTKDALALAVDESHSDDQGLHDMLSSTLRHYQDLGDVQTCSTICLVLADHMTVDSEQADEWLFCYVDMLRRQKLFTIVAEVINNAKSEVLKSMAEGDVITSTSCARCRKAVPLVREGAGAYWMCPRCQNTVRCILCLQVIKGEASWCPMCTHAAHPRCRTALSAEFEGKCVAPDCNCECRA